jgi:CheY-like chemotaxis protein
MELKEATVLVVDDEPMLRDIFSEWLREENCRVLTAENGSVALQIVLRDHVDAIVSDVRMPGMGGMTLLKNLRAHGGVSNGNLVPKLIFISGFADLEPRDAYNLGAEAILQKPIHRAQFVDCVRRVVRRREES